MVHDCLFVMGDEAYKVFSLNFKTYLGIEPYQAKNSLEARNLLSDENCKIHLIICQTDIAKEKTLKIVLDSLQEIKKDTPLISLGEDPTIFDAYHKMNIASTEEADDIREAVRLAADFLKISAKDMMSLPTAKYFPIPITHFISLEKSPTDTFIKIGKGDNTQFIKRIHEGEGLEKNTIDRYMTSGVVDLYVESENRIKFVEAITEQLIKVIDDPESTVEDTMSAADKIQETVARNIEVLGITPQIERSCRRAMKQMKSDGDKFPIIKSLLALLIKNKAGFRFKHSQITGYLATAILRKIDWGKNEQEETLTFVSFFHDISIKKDSMCQIDSEKALKDAAYTDKDKERLNQHAQKSAELIHNYPHAPMGASTIIRQHHGIMNGLGYSDSYSGSLSPLAIVFMVAEKAAHLVLESEFEELNRMKIMYDLEKVFKTKRFEKMLEAISEVMK